MKTIITGGFWKRYQQLVYDKVVPYQWETLNDRVEGADPSYSIANMKAAAGLTERVHHGDVFQDSDLYKWIECAAYCLMDHNDSTLEEEVDSVIDLMEKAQMPDGYLDTYYQLKGGIENRFTNLRDNHELYCLGHMTEAAVAYYQATGKSKLLKIAERFIACVEDHIGPEEGKLHGYPGHEELELALVKLADLTKDSHYLDLAAYFINQRGRQPLYFEEEAKAHGREPSFYGDLSYYQADMPIRDQQEVKGHAVRAGYYYAAAADVARLTDDQSLKEAVRRLFANVTQHKMSINGGVGACEFGEAYGANDDLPNDTVYNESCASIALVLWAQRMLKMDEEASYADVMENAIFNGVLCGINVRGDRFFYVNPLQVDGPSANMRYDHRHVAVERQKWFGCACCPPNIARLIASIGQYVALQQKNSLLVNLYADAATEFDIEGKDIKLIQHTDYPWNGTVHMMLSMADPVRFALKLRIPRWASKVILYVNGKPVQAPVENGYMVLDQTFYNSDRIDLSLSMKPVKVWANTRIIEDTGKAAVMRGPILYAAEEVDNGKQLASLYLGKDPVTLMEKKTASKVDDETDTGKEADLNDPEGILKSQITLKAKGYRLVSADEKAYSTAKPALKRQDLILVPYFLWGNRGRGEMRVYLNDLLK